MDYFFITFKQVGILLFYILAGMALRKTGKFGKNASNVIATLLIYFISPCYSLVKMSENFSINEISKYLEMFLAGIFVTAVGLGLSFIIRRFFAKQGYMRNVYTYMFAFANIGFFGNPLVEAIFGGAVLVKYLIFSLPMNLAIATYGFIILTDVSGEDGNSTSLQDKKKHILRVLLNPSTLFLFIGLGLGLCSIKLPNKIVEFLNPAVVCYTALPMILLGTVLGGFEIKKLFSSIKAYLVSVVKLIIIPAIFGIIAYIAFIIGISKETCLFIVLITSLPPGMNVVTYPESFGIDSSENAKMLFVSYIICLITLSVIVMIATSLLGI